MRYVLKKLALLLLTLLIISLLAFLAFQVIPGDPTTKMLGSEATPERVAALRQELGLDQPVLARYWHWLTGCFKGELGLSYSYFQPVETVLSGKIQVTAWLSGLAFLLVIVLALPVGVLLARFEGGPVDKAMTVLNQIVMSVPAFFIGILFTYLFGLVLRFFTPGGYVSWRTDMGAFLRYMIFPALAVALPKAAMCVKLLRSSILQELDQDYVRTGYSRGRSRGSVLRHHVLRNAVIPTITFLAVTLADIVAGSIIIEQVFSLPGIGRLLLLSISNRDFPVVQVIVVLIASLVVIINFLADISYQYIDPRIRLDR